MRKLLFLLASPLAAESIADLAWIAGHWTGTLGKAAIEENWLAPAGGAMLGVSRTVAGARMVAFEFLRLETRGDGIYYVAQPGGRPATAFKLTRSSPEEAVFENPQHDHPKIIKYQKEGADVLVATIEGDEGGRRKRQSFRFFRAAEAYRK